MTQTVSAVIPTLGRPSLSRAVQSVLGQTRPVDELIVVADSDVPVTLPPDDRISLCFPTDLARNIRWDAHVGTAHDEPSWLIHVQRAIPDLRVIQLPEILSTYNVTNTSVSRRRSDCTESYIEWGLQYLKPESPRVLGDYLCTSPVSAAVSARSLRGVLRALQSAFRHGRPGPFAVGYAVLSAARVVLRRAKSAVRP